MNKNWVWKKVPSVTTGGKPYFFVAFHEDNTGRTKTTVVWDRTKRKWAVEMNEQVIDYFDTAAEGRRFAQFGR